MMTLEEAKAEVRKRPVNHPGVGEFTSPAIFQAAAVLLAALEEAEQAIGIQEEWEQWGGSDDW